MWLWSCSLSSECWCFRLITSFFKSPTWLQTWFLRSKFWAFKSSSSAFNSVFWLWMVWSWEVKVSKREETTSFACSREIWTNILIGGEEGWGSGSEVWVSVSGGVGALGGGEMDVLGGRKADGLGEGGGGIGEGWGSDPTFLVYFSSSFIKLILVRMPRV